MSFLLLFKISATNLPNVEKVGKSDPYASVQFQGNLCRYFISRPTGSLIITCSLKPLCEAMVSSDITFAISIDRHLTAVFFGLFEKLPSATLFC